MLNVVVHLAKTGKFGCLEPVGLWRQTASDAFHEPDAYYPPEHAHRSAAGYKALHNRPYSTPWQEWILWRASTSPSWKMLEDYTLGMHGLGDLLIDVAANAPLEPLYATVQKTFLASSPPPPPEPILTTLPTQGPLEPCEVGTALPNARLINAESWWLASEVARRHPELIIYEMHPGGGGYDVLSLGAPEWFSSSCNEEPGPKMDLVRNGRLHVHKSSSYEGSRVLATWADVLSGEDPHVWVLRIESELQLKHPKPSPLTTSKTIVYRTIAQILAMTVHDRDFWDARSEFCDSTGDDRNFRNYLDSFPGAREDCRALSRLDVSGQPEANFWGLLRKTEVVALFSTDGIVYAGNNRVELLKVYESFGRKILPTAMRVLELAQL